MMQLRTMSTGRVVYRSSHTAAHLLVSGWLIESTMCRMTTQHRTPRSEWWHLLRVIMLQASRRLCS